MHPLRIYKVTPPNWRDAFRKSNQLPPRTTRFSLPLWLELPGDALEMGEHVCPLRARYSSNEGEEATEKITF
jgi:hypothetical protein